MQVKPLPLQGLLLVTPKVFGDDRGWFFESYHYPRFAELGVKIPFVQDNHSCSSQGTLRGMHFQTDPGQAKLVRCILGQVWDVAVDIRPESSTFGQWHAEILSSENHSQLYIPVGFAHGFLVLSEKAEVQYKCSAIYDAKTEAGFMWNDPDVKIDWPLKGLKPVLSERDKNNPSFKAFFKLS